MQGVQPAPALLLEQRGQDGGIVDAPGAVHVVGPNEWRLGKGPPAADLLTERGQVLVGDRGDVRIAFPEEDRVMAQVSEVQAVPVAELALPLIERIEQVQVHAQRRERPWG